MVWDPYQSWSLDAASAKSSSPGVHTFITLENTRFTSFEKAAGLSYPVLLPFLSKRFKTVPKSIGCLTCFWYSSTDIPCSSGFNGARKDFESSSFMISSSNSRQAANFFGKTLAAVASASSTMILHLSHFNLSCVSLGVPSRSYDSVSVAMNSKSQRRDEKHNRNINIWTNEASEVLTLNKFFRSLVLSSLTCALSSTTDWRPSFDSCRWKIFSSTVPVAMNRYVKLLDEVSRRM